MLTSGVPYENITWFVATQNETLVKWFKTTRKRGNVVWFEASPTLAYDTTTANVIGKRAAIFTFYLMSESDDIIATDSSSFGTA
jgi:hypothetical protein